MERTAGSSCVKLCIMQFARSRDHMFCLPVHDIVSVTHSNRFASWRLAALLHLRPYDTVEVGTVFWLLSSSKAATTRAQTQQILDPHLHHTTGRWEENEESALKAVVKELCALNTAVAAAVKQAEVCVLCVHVGACVSTD